MTDDQPPDALKKPIQLASLEKPVPANDTDNADDNFSLILSIEDHAEQILEDLETCIDGIENLALAATIASEDLNTVEIETLAGKLGLSVEAFESLAKIGKRFGDTSKRYLNDSAAAHEDFKKLGNIISEILIAQSRLT